MLTLLVGFLTALLILTCIVLILLVLMQLPKKEAGLGTAFGTTATDALFGSGTGNALSKMTKYSTIAFLVLSVALAIIGNARSKSDGATRLKEALEKAAKAAPAAPAKAPEPAAAATNVALKLGAPAPAAPAAPATNVIKLQTPPAATNAPGK